MRERALWKPEACFRMRLRRRRALNPLFARGMAYSCSTVGQKALDLAFMRLRNHVVVAQAAQALPGLVDQAVVTTTLGTTDAAAPADLEPLRRGLVCLHLRH